VGLGARCKAQATLRSSSSFLVAGNKITANSYCDCPAPNAKHCTCYSAQVIRFGSDCTVSRDDKEAKNVTMKQTGVPFFGKAKIVNPGTPHATIVK
jgi:hypothetical protein